MGSSSTNQSSGWRSRWGAVGAAVAVTLGAGGLVTSDAASSVPSSFVAITPTRILDTRTDVGLDGPFVSGVAQTLQVTGTIPTQPAGGGDPVLADVVLPAATSVVLNVTVVRPSTTGFLSVRPGGAQGIPATSNINWAATGANTANAVTVQLPTTGEIDIYVRGTVADVLIDVAGFHLPETAAPAGPVGPEGPPGPAGPDGAPGPEGPVNRISDEQIARLQWYLDPGAAGTYPTGGGPWGVAFDGTHIWITNQGSNTASKMNPADGTRVDHPTGERPSGVAFDGTHIWITNLNDVSKMNPIDGTRVEYPTGLGPTGVAFDGTHIWITNHLDQTVSKMDPADGSRVDYITGEEPYGVAFDGSHIWITSTYENTVSKMNPADGSRVDYPTGESPTGVAFDGTSIWITNHDSNTISKMSPADGSRVDYPTRDEPFGVAFDGTSIWITHRNSSGGAVSKMNPIDGTRVDYPVGDRSAGVAFDGTNVWVANPGDDTVSKLIPG